MSNLRPEQETLQSWLSAGMMQQQQQQQQQQQNKTKQNN